MKKLVLVFIALISFSSMARTRALDELLNAAKDYDVPKKLLVTRDYSPLKMARFLVEEKGLNADDVFVVSDGKEWGMNSTVLDLLLTYVTKKCELGFNEKKYSEDNPQCKNWYVVGGASPEKLEALRVNKPKSYAQYQEVKQSYDAYIADLKLAIKYLVDRGADINYNSDVSFGRMSKNNTPLAQAIRSFYDVDLVKYLVGLGAKPNLVFRAAIDEESPFSVAASLGGYNGPTHPEVIRVLNYFKFELKYKYVDDRCTVLRNAGTILLEYWAQEDGISNYLDLEHNCDKAELELSRADLWDKRNVEYGWTLALDGKYYQ